MITETPLIPRKVQPEERFVTELKKQLRIYAEEINKLERDVDDKYYTKEEVGVAISEALAELISTSADVIETLDDVSEIVDGKLDKGSPDYVKEVVVDGQNIVVTTGDNKTSIKQIQIPDVPTKTSDLINDSNYISKVYWGDIINKPTIPTIPKNVSAFNNDSGYITGVSWDEVTSKPTFATVATSGSYLDLSNTPTIPKKVSDLTNDTGYITGVSWNEVTGKPNFATVATSGSYTDLSNKPTIPTVPTKVSAFTNDAGYITGVAWNDITNKPSTFAPSTHTHSYLPLSGGTMTGSIMFTGANDRGAGVDLNNNGTNFDIGWNWTNRDGAGFYLRSTDFSATTGGGFGAYARNATNSYDLFGNPNGSLTWNGTSFSVGGGTGSLNGIATSANALNNLYTVSTRPTSANTCYADGKLRVYLATSTMTTGKPPSDAQILHLAWDNSKYDSQIAVSTSGDLYWRTQKGSDTWGAWQTAAKSGHTHDYLPLSGGTMSGAIKTSANVLAQKTVDDSFLLLTGASDYTKGACLSLNGKDRSGYTGAFELQAKDGTNSTKTLRGDGNGSLTWDNTNISLEGHTHSEYLTSSSLVYEANLKWGGKNFTGGYGCIDAAMVDELGANRMMFAKAAGITVEYSRDAGSTWTNYGLTDAQKVDLFSVGRYISIGKADSTNKATANTNKYQLRITINTSAAEIYTELNKFVFYVSTNGSNSSTVTIQKALQSTPDTYVTIAENVSISGWSGYNVVNVEAFRTYGNTAASQYGRIRFIFKANGGNTKYTGLQINKIMGFGGMGWTTPSTMAKTGHLYSFDSSQNATFPADVNVTGTLTTNNLTVTKINGVTVGSSPKFTDTTYSSMSATEATTGTATTARVITAKVLHDKIKEIVNQAMTKNNLTKI